jgi:type III secretion protein Y
MTTKDEILQLLHGLGHIYADHGHTKRALVLQLIASHIDPGNKPLLRTLAQTFLDDDAPERALAVISRLRALDEDDPLLDLLQSKALWMNGQEMEARRMFRDFLERRKRADDA